MAPKPEHLPSPVKRRPFSEFKPFGESGMTVVYAGKPSEKREAELRTSITGRISTPRVASSPVEPPVGG